MTPKSAKAVTCARDAMAYPPDSFSLPTDGRKAKDVCEKRRNVFIQFALYADGDGTRAWPGNKRIAFECGFSERTTKRLIADLKELGCVSEAVGPDGKIKLHGPRGTTERLVTPSALPLPGSTPWSPLPDGKHVQRLVNTGFGCTFDKDGKMVLFGTPPKNWPGAVGPDSDFTDGAVGPNSNPVGPNTIAVGPKPADFGPQPPALPTLTAPTTATNPAQPGAVEAGSVKDAGTRMVRRLAEQLQYTSLPATKGQKAALDKLAIGVPGSIMAVAIRMWVVERPKGFHGLKDPVGRMVEELPDYIAAAVAAANAPPPGADMPVTAEEAARERAATLAANGYTEEEWAKVERDTAYDTNGEAIMRALNLPQQGQEE